MTTAQLLEKQEVVTTVGTEQKRKRFYAKGEYVFIKTLKKSGKIVSLDTKNLEAVLTIKDNGEIVEKTIPFKYLDKLRKREDISSTTGKTTVVNSINNISVIKQNQPWNKQNTSTSPNRNYKGNVGNVDVKPATKQRDTLLFAKVRPDAIIPSKNFEDAGYDIYANFEGDEMVMKKGTVNLVPTGIASSVLPKYFLNFKHERGTTGLQGMAVFSGVIDSGYRGEIFVNMIPLLRDIIISKTYKFPLNEKGKQIPVEFKGHTYFPYSVAMCQATLDIVPNVVVKEISYEALKAIPSKRGTGSLGSSGK